MSEPPRNEVLVGDALDQLRRLPPASVDCVITSPPYWGLRDYQVEGQLGLEDSVHEWVDNLGAVMDEVGRVLKPTGTLWLNIADTYSRRRSHGAPPKGFVLGPERLLLRLTQSGWLLRNRVVWAKSNPLPASVRDRLSCTWEPLYLLVRQGAYYFDLDAIREPLTSEQRSRRTSVDLPRRRPAWAGPMANGDHSGLARLHASGRSGNPLGKNPGDVWQLATAGYRGAHFATFPQALLRRPVLAGCPERVCASCDTPWRRRSVTHDIGQTALVGAVEQACGCRGTWRPGLVLDPFFGAGTTGVVAERFDRDWLGIELNPRFAELAGRRIQSARAGPQAA